MDTSPLTRLVPLDYLAANQAIAALDDRIREMQAHHDPARCDLSLTIAAAHRAVVAIRATFHVERRQPYTEDPGVTPQLAQYQAESR